MKNYTLLTLCFLFYGSLFAQTDEKIVSLVVTGTGKTKDEAKQNALRSAVEQAFGAFISSKTELLNDSLVKDEIVSISNGNINKFEIVSEIPIPPNGYAISLNASVSITQLTSFCESKGITAELKGGLFAANMKQKILNESAELSAVNNLCDVSWDVLSKSIDYSIKIGESPQLLNKENQLYSVSMLIEAKTNQNKSSFYEYFKNTLLKISLSPSDLESFKAANIPYYTLYFNEKRKINEKLTKKELIPIILRSESSLIAIKNLLVRANKFYFDFLITTGVDSITLNPNALKNNIIGDAYYYDHGLEYRLNKFFVGVNGLLGSEVSFNDRLLTGDNLISVSAINDINFGYSCQRPAPLNLFMQILESDVISKWDGPIWNLIGSFSGVNTVKINSWDNVFFNYFSYQIRENNDNYWFFANCSNLVIEENQESKIYVFIQKSYNLDELNRISEVKIMPK
jgi:hypothetical protein